MAGNTSTPGASVASRVLALLGSFDGNHRDLSLTELSHRSGLALATTHRLAQELTAGGAIRRRDDGRYVIGRRLWDLGLLAPLQSGLRARAAPFLQDVFGATRATVHLAIRDGSQVLYLDRLMGTTSVPVISSVGSRLPLHCTGVGKVLLAHAPKNVQAEVLGRLERFTPYTIIQPGKLQRQLEEVVDVGFATTVEEMTLGACSIAVPVVATTPGHAGSVVAALGLVVPSIGRDRARLVSALEVASRGIGRSA